MSRKTKDKVKTNDVYEVVYTITVPADIVEEAKEQGKDAEDCAWHVMETTHVKPTIKKIIGSVPHAILGPFITHPDQSRGPAMFEDFPSDKYVDLLHRDYIDPNIMFGNYDTLEELTSFLADVPEFCVGGLFYEN
ncbi:hypothetical protein LCGC14_3026800 [marine sediment metagenome]|uniref:Uncharacterized protein n=1 Tax=marine sediment metagenome TaxID=412755 RepID=A0A0F8WTF9_9ZZZZ